MKGHLIFIFASLFVLQVKSLTTIPTFKITNKYIETGTYTLTTQGYYYGNTSWAGSQVSIFSIPYLITHASYTVQVSIQQLNFAIAPTNLLNTTIQRCTYYPTYLSTCLISNTLSNLYTLRIRYLLLQSGFSKILLYTLFDYSSGLRTINSTSPQIINYGIASINITGTPRTFIAYIGFNVTAPDNNLQFDIKTTATFLSSTVLQVRISTTVVNNIGLLAITLAFIGYSEETVAAWPFPSARLNYATFSGASNSPAVYTDLLTLSRGFNTFWGLTRLNVNNQANIHFSSDLSPMIDIQGTSLYPFNNLDYNVIIFQFKECDPTTPSYMISQDLCYDICPQRYYENNTQLLCKTCVNYDCYKCDSSGLCTICSNSTDHRVLNNITNRCDPMTGYYDDGTSNPLAKPCDISCKTCLTTSNYCTSCDSGFYVDALNACSPCISNCQICSNSLTCTICNIYYKLDSSNACVSIINCSAISNCQTCNISNGCTQCSLGYIVVNSTSCASVCGNGIKISSEGCDDNNTVGSDGCSTTCTVESGFFCVGLIGATSICSPCSTHCSVCTSAINCQTCSNPYLLNNITFSCVPNCSLINLCLTCHEPNGTTITLCDSCSYGYSPSSNICSAKCGDGILILPQQCDDGNNANGDGCSSICTFEANSACIVAFNKSQCSVCSSKFYANSNHSSCIACSNYDCQTCDSSGNCLTCNILSHRTLNLSTNRCPPNDGYYDNGSNQTASSCSSICLTCSGGANNTCLSCTSARALVNGTCIMCSLLAGDGCNSCSSNSNVTCLSCNGTLSNGICTSSAVEDTTSKLLLMILLPLLLSLCCCCLIIFLIWRRRRHEQNKVQQEQEPEAKNQEAKPYKVQSKKLDGKVQNYETEVNELSMDEIKIAKQLNDIKVEIIRDKSEMNDNYDISDKSDFSKSAEQDEEDGQSRGCTY